MSTSFNLGRDLTGANTFLAPDSNNKMSMVLAAGVAQTVTVPLAENSSQYKWDVIFSFEPGSKVWTAINSVAVVPAGAVSATNSSLNRVGYCRLKSGDTISFITDDTLVEVGVEFFNAV
jgi:hypothetical protein